MEGPHVASSQRRREEVETYKCSLPEFLEFVELEFLRRKPGHLLSTRDQAVLGDDKERSIVSEQDEGFS